MILVGDPFNLRPMDRCETAILRLGEGRKSRRVFGGDGSESKIVLDNDARLLLELAE